MSAREFLLVLTNVLMGAFVITCVIVVLCSFIGEIIRRHGGRVLSVFGHFWLAHARQGSLSNKKFS